MKNITPENVREYSDAPDQIFNRKFQSYLWDSSGLNSDDCSKILIKYKRAMEHFELDFWLTYGTALGFYRDGDFIPWDDDVDSHVDGHRMLEIGVENIRQYFISEGVVARAKERGLNSKMSLFYKGVKMQLQGVYEKDEMMHAKLFHYPKRFYENYELFNYKGETYKLPGPPDEYLTFCYDKNWNTPQNIPDWRDYMNPDQIKSKAWLSDQKAHRRIKNRS